MDKTLAWLTLHLTPGIGTTTARKLVTYFGSPELVFLARDQDLQKVPGINRSIAVTLQSPAHDNAVRELKKAEQMGVSILCWEDGAYPELLRNIHNPPLLLYVLGDLDSLKAPCVGIVGARASTDYGRKMAAHFATGLAGHQVTVVSGMALGIDTAAHEGSLTAGGKTIAVLGCGLDVIYPQGNARLYKRIATQGAIISEYPFGTKPDNFRFPARNRIISGLSQGVVVVEATRHSGSLITAHLALEQGREVFAVPGRVDSFKSEGSHQLLKEGAKLVHSVDDIFEELQIFSSHEMTTRDKVNFSGSREEVTLSAEEKTVLDFLDVYPKTIDEIIRETQMSPQKVNQMLLMLELKRIVKALPGKQYQTCN